MMPQIPMARPLMAPSVRPISSALAVPMPWAQAPMPSPAAMGSFTRNSFTRKGAVRLPRMPVKITAATVMETMPPWLSTPPANW